MKLCREKPMILNFLHGLLGHRADIKWTKSVIMFSFLTFGGRNRLFWFPHFENCLEDYLASSRTLDPDSKSKFNLGLTTSTLLHRLVLLSVCFIYPMSGRYNTNWDRKGWPGSEIQMYYGCPWTERKYMLYFSKNSNL